MRYSCRRWVVHHKEVGGQPQTIGLLPSGSILGTGAKSLTARAINGCASGNVTVGAINLAVVGFN